MPFVNDGYGCIHEEANPHTGTAKLFWRPLHPQKDNGHAKGSEPPDWNEGDPQWAYKPILQFTAKEWAYDDKPPFSWYVTTSPATTWLLGLAGNWSNVTTTLYVFVAPHVQVKRLPLDLGYYFQEPDIKIVRLDSVYEVPPPGGSANIGLLTGERPTLEYFNGRLSPGDGSEKINSGDFDDRTSSFSLPALHIIRGPLGITIEKPTEYRINIRLHEEKPSFFRITIHRQFVTNTHSGLERRLVNVFRVIHDANTIVEFNVNGLALQLGTAHVLAELETRKVYNRVNKAGRPVSPPWTAENGSPDTAMTIVQDRFADPYYYDFEHGKWETFDPNPDLFGLDTAFQMAIGAIPVVGQLYDIADMVCIAATGKDLLGAKKTNTDIILIGAFSLLGILGDLSRFVDISMMTRIAEYLFPGAKIVSKNPNFFMSLVRGAFSGTPAYSYAGEVLAKQHGPDFMREMDRLIHIGDLDGLKEFAKKFKVDFEAVLRTNAKTIRFDQQPATLELLKQHSARLETLLDNLEELPADKATQIRTVWANAHADKSFKNVIAKIRQIDPTAEKELMTALRDQIIFDVNCDPTIIRRAAAYAGKHGLKGFFAKHKVPFSPFTYLTKVTKNTTEVRTAFELKYGTDTWALLTGSKPRKPTRSPDQLISDYAANIKLWMNNIDAYFLHRQYITKNYPGMGIILNSDHLIEERFRKFMGNADFVDSSMFRAILVPPSLGIARKLRAAGIDIGWYIHQQKTSRMNQILPQKVESYTTQEIADAYQFFWIHEMKMPPKMFQKLFEQELQYLDIARLGQDVFEGMENANAGKIVFTVLKSKQELLRLINKRLTKMDLDPVEEARIGKRVSNAPGL